MSLPQSTNRSNPILVWFPYGVGATLFIALVAYVLGLGTSRDGRMCLWLFVAMYPVFTLPVLVTYLRICEHAPQRGTDACPSWLVPLLMGLLPAVLLSIGRFILTLPRQPAELPIFLALVATLFVHVLMARRLYRAQARLQRDATADSISAETPARSHRLKWPYTGLAAAMMLAAMIPYSPIWRTPAVVMLPATHMMVLVGVFLMVDALKRRQHFALQMTALFMSSYMAVGSIIWYVVR